MSMNQSAPKAPLRIALVAIALQLPVNLVYAEESNAGFSHRTAVETNVSSALRSSKSISSPGDIKVEDKQGVITLSGTVANSVEAQHALDAARSVAGVSNVEDKLVRKSNSGMEASPHQSETVGAPLKQKKGMEEGPATD